MSYGSERYFAKYTWALGAATPATAEDRYHLAKQIRMLMDCRKGLKPGDPRVVDAARMLDVMRGKAATLRGLLGGRTKNEVALEGAKVDGAVADESGVAMLATVASLKTAFVKRLDELSENVSTHLMVTTRATHTALTVASAVMSGVPDEKADEADEADEAEDAAVEIPSRKRVRAQSTQSPKKAKLVLPACEVL